MKRNILLNIEYKGGKFEGWQVQAKGRTVQGEVLAQLSKFIPGKISLMGAGRTDSGVHALNQYANFKAQTDFSNKQIKYKLNRMLDDDIVIKNCIDVPLDFDSRKSAVSRVYRYLISEKLSALDSGLSWVYGKRLDKSQLDILAKIIRKNRDFSNFCKVKSRKKDNTCIIISAKWRRYGGRLIFEIEADRFLHNMVRLLVGTMVAVENGKLSLDRFKLMLKNKVDDKSGYIAPSRGLYLADVKYEGVKL